MDTNNQTPNPMPQAPTYTPPAPQPAPVTPPPMPQPPRPTPPVTSVPPVTPPPAYTPPQKPSGHGREASVILPALLVILLAGAGYYWFSARSIPSAPQAPAAPAATTSQAANPVTQASAQVVAHPADVPAGFPADIPVEKANLTESYKKDYPAQHVSQYTVAYTSAKTKDALWVVFSNYFATAGYKLNTTVTNKAQGVMDGTKGKSELNVVLSNHGTEALVQITYLAR